MVEKQNRGEESEYVVARNMAEVAKRRAKRESWEAMGRRMEEELGRDNDRFLYGIAKSYRKTKATSANIKNSAGEVLVGAEEVNDRWTEYFQSLLNLEMELDERDKIEEAVGEQVLGEEFTMEELQWALKKMKNGKFPGVDGVG